MNRQTFNKGLTLLVTAFPLESDSMTDERIELYWAKLTEIPDDRFRLGVDWCISHLERFPTIARLGAACYNGNLNWVEQVKADKRPAKRKAIEPPLNEAEIEAAKAFIRGIVQDLAPKPVKQSVEEQREKLKKQAEEIRAWKKSE